MLFTFWDQEYWKQMLLLQIIYHKCCSHMPCTIIKDMPYAAKRNQSFWRVRVKCCKKIQKKKTILLDTCAAETIYCMNCRKVTQRYKIKNGLFIIFMIYRMPYFPVNTSILIYIPRWCYSWQLCELPVRSENRKKVKLMFPYRCYERQLCNCRCWDVIDTEFVKY